MEILTEKFIMNNTLAMTAASELDSSVFTITFMMSGLFFVTGLLMVVLPLIWRYSTLEVCTLPVKAKCVKIHMEFSEGNRMYAPVWEYTVNGKVYCHQEKVHTYSQKQVVGEEYDIMVNPKNPNQIYRKTFGFTEILVPLGACFLFFSFAVFIIGIFMLFVIR